VALLENIIHQEILFLPSLYRQFENQCHIISFHGTNDSFDNFLEKEKFCSDVKQCIFKPISEQEVDGEIFKSSNHGLDADFLELFDFAYKQYSGELKNNKLLIIPIPSIIYEIRNTQYNITYETGIPMLEIKML